MTAEPIWLTEARKYIGVREIKGAAAESRIVQWWKTIRLGGIREDETPWCAAYVGAMLENVGLMSARSGWAKNYLTWGAPLEYPLIGCIVVFDRLGGGGHVGFVVGRDEKFRLMVLGGNQGDAVSIAPFDLSRVVGYRWPAPIPVPLAERLPIIVTGDAPASTREA